MATANLADNDNIAGLDTNVLIPNTRDKIGCLKNRVNTWNILVAMFIA